MSEYLNLKCRIYKGIGEYNIPKINAVHNVKELNWIGFNYAKSTQKQKSKIGIDFFLHDYQFERVWNYPERYLECLKEYGALLSPDFSLYTDFPKAIQIFNHYRKHWLGAFWQENKICVIPTISWSDKASYEWCFDGEPEGGVVAVSNVGCMNNKSARKLFMDGYNEMISRLQPSKILLFAHKTDDYKGNVQVVNYSLFREKGI